MSEYLKDWRNFIAERDVRAVICVDERDAAGVDYSVSVRLGDVRGAFEVGDDQHSIWSRRVEFGRGPNVAGGSAFRAASREQDAIAQEIIRLRNFPGAAPVEHLGELVVRKGLRRGQGGRKRP